MTHKSCSCHTKALTSGSGSWAHLLERSSSSGFCREVRATESEAEARHSWGTGRRLIKVLSWGQQGGQMPAGCKSAWG